MTVKTTCNVSEDTGRIPTNLPPPYTWTGTRAGQLRANPSDLTKTSTLLIGPKSTPFTIHTSLLTSQSAYFRAALTGPFTESAANSITLDDIDVPHCQLLTSWLYTSAIPPPFKDGKPAYYTLLHLYALADRLCFEGLRNAVIDLIADLADQTNSVLTPSDTRILYSEIRDSAPLRNLILDLFAFKKTDRLLESHADTWHAGFLRDLTVLLKRPVEQAMQRHRLVMWNPQSWHGTRACENCRAMLPPRYAAVACEECCVAFCTRCVEGGVCMAGWDDGRGRWEVIEEERSTSTATTANNSSTASPSGEATEGGAGEETKTIAKRVRKWESCKPWRGSRCLLYHEHVETERCGDVFMGR